MQFWTMFDHLGQGAFSGQRLLELQQGRDSATKYLMRLCVPAAGRGWNDLALITHFWNGLDSELQKELLVRESGLGLKALMNHPWISI